MQAAAMLTMLIDHVGLLFFPDNPVWRMIGRSAFPIYAYCIVQGFHHTRNRNKYLTRLVILAAVSQAPYTLALYPDDPQNINVIGSFAVCLGVLMLMDRYKSWPAFIGLTAAAGLLLELLPFSYGAYGLLLILIYKRLPRSFWTPAHILLNLASLWYGHGWLIQSYSVVPTIFLAYRDKLFAGFRLGWRTPRWLWRSFYPAHLALLALAVYWVNAS